MNGVSPFFPAFIGMVPGPGLLFGLMLVSAIVGGFIAHSVRVPRVIGFLLGGVALRVVLYAVFVSPGGEDKAEALQAAVKPLGAIKDLALGLILFQIGEVFERTRIRSAAPKVLRISVLEILFVVGFVFVGCSVAAIITQRGEGLGANLVLALLLATAAIATAPAATLFVLQEYEAKGPTTETILGLTGVNNVVCIVLFQATFLILASLGAIETAAAMGERLWEGLAVTTLGSVALGIIMGTLISMIHAKLPLGETLLVFFALFIVLGAGEHWLSSQKGISFSFLLTALVTGAVFANLAVDSEKLNTSLRTLGSPIFVGFFVMAGYELHLGDLTLMGWIGGAYVVCRLVGKILGGHFGVRWVGTTHRVGNRVGTALLCQAAVVIGLATFVERSWDSPLAHQFATIVLGSVVVFELLGPLLIKRCVVGRGEVKAITLLRRSGPHTEGASVIRLTLQSLLRLLGVQSNRVKTAPEDMKVEHIMRTNVQFIRASATYDEVLHFIERSTYSHFPVVHEGGVFAGVIHFADVRDVIYDPAMRELVTALDLADPDSIVVPMDMSLGNLLRVFEGQNVGVLPVAERGNPERIVGIVEQRDLLRALHLTQPSGAPADRSPGEGER